MTWNFGKIQHIYIQYVQVSEKKSEQNLETGP